MDREEFEKVKEEWVKFGDSLKGTIPRMRCFFCLKDLTNVDAFFSETDEAAVCKDHCR